MARRQLTDLLEPRGTQDEPIKVGEAPSVVERTAAPRLSAEAPVAPPPAAPTEPADQPTSSPQPRLVSRTKPTRSPARPKSEELPPYLTFERKETRLRPDQVTELNVKARELNKSKDRTADRITDNTLIRVAVDLMLSRAKDLKGGDETQLRKSLGI